MMTMQSTAMQSTTMQSTELLPTLQSATVGKSTELLPEEYRQLSDEEAVSRIRTVREQLADRVVVLGHHYQRDEVMQFADHCGDSLRLCQLAAKSRASYIVFCGVHFMAESADILSSDEQIVTLPDITAGCTMADMAQDEKVMDAWKQILAIVPAGHIVPITYVNSSAAIKAFCGRNEGMCCTSSNAAKMMGPALDKGRKVFFLPDEHLGRYTARTMGIREEDMIVWNYMHPVLGGNSAEAVAKAKVILWRGCCSVHMMFRPEHVKQVRQQHPEAKIIVHPECRYEICEKADAVGSTEQIVKTIKEAESGSTWAIGTEHHLVNRLAKEHPDKTVFSLSSTQCLCGTMYRISPQHLLWNLEELSKGNVINQVTVPDTIKKDARLALNRMLERS